MSKRLLLASVVTVIAGAIAIVGTSVATVRAALAPAHVAETVLYSFHGAQDGASPMGGVVADAAGALYGSTLLGGNEDLGTVFKLVPTPSGYEQSTIYQFPSGSAGEQPQGGVIVDRAGAVYGTAMWGGGGGPNGVVFKLTSTPRGYVAGTIHIFSGKPNDGSHPGAALTAGPNGVFFGTTQDGGAADGGTVFELKRSGTGYSERVLYSFQGGAHDGAGPYAPVVVNAAGVIFGTTIAGGGIL